MPAPLFSTPPTDLAGAALVAMDEATAAILGPALAEIDPWARMDYPASQLMAYLQANDPAVRKFAIRRDGATAGVVALRHPWLKGPYVELLALLPDHQGHGIGSAALDWIEREAAATQRNLWVVTSAFNEGALAFYRRHGFEPVGRLPDLVYDGFEEILLRKRLRVSSKG
ncbi:MAG: GNAT family N-acetyltransferase [Hyphomicrobiales bacterium]|nr:GNAT family N-acetyltransferase [Hyphomicrobiales bacterium]